MTPPLLDISGLTVRFRTERGSFAAVDGLDLRVGRGEFVGIVGESGSGKSVTARAIMGLVRPPGRVAAGSIRFAGAPLAAMPISTMPSCTALTISGLRRSRMSTVTSG